MTTPRLTLALSLLSAGAVIAGCGGSSSSGSSASTSPKTDTTTSTAAKAPASTGGSGATLALAADPGGKIAFDKKSLQAKTGTTTIDFTNASQVPHAVDIEGAGVHKETKTITASKASVTVNLKPGSYTFYCPVADHRAEGMKGTLTVR